jgi:Na+/H+ antiporter NhaC
MTRLAIFLFLFVGLSLGGVFLLSSWHIPAPTVAINKVIPDAELSK